MEACDLAFALSAEADPGRDDSLARAVRRIQGRALECSLDREATAGEAFQAIALSCLCRFARNRAELARTADPEALHQARVALRQLRSALSLFRPVVEDERFEPLRRELRWLAGATNEARDLDALLARIDAPPASLAAARERAYARALKALGSARALRLQHELVDWLTEGTWIDVRNPPDLTAAAFAEDALGRLRRKLARKGRRFRSLDDAHLHEVRIAAKKLRYAAGFFEGLFPGDGAHRREKRFGKGMRGLQERLGDLQDAAVAPALLQRLHVPRASWPPLANRRRLVRKADATFERVLDCKPYWH